MIESGLDEIGNQNYDYEDLELIETDLRKLKTVIRCVKTKTWLYLYKEVIYGLRIEL